MNSRLNFFPFVVRVWQGRGLPSIFLLAKTLACCYARNFVAMKTMPGAVPPAFITASQPKDTTCTRSPGRCAGITSLGNALAAASSPFLTHTEGRKSARGRDIRNFPHTVSRPSTTQDVPRSEG